MLKKGKIRLKKSVKAFIGLVILVILISFTESSQGDRVVPVCDIRIYPELSSHFVDKEDVMKIVTHNGRRKLVGENVDKINIESLEKAIKRDKFVEKAQVYRDLKGNLIINVRQRKPIARVLQNDTSFYLGSKGHCLPPSKRFSARVPMVTGHVVSNYFSDEDNASGNTPKQENPKRSALFELLRAIEKDKFLSILVSQLYVNQEGEIDLYMQMSKQVVHIGAPEDIEDKLNRVKLFYHKILLNKGYGHYTKVNVEYKNQIVCE